MPSAKQKRSVFAKSPRKSGIFADNKSNSKLSSSDATSLSDSTVTTSDKSFANCEESQQEKKDFFLEFYETDSESLEEEEEEPEYLKRPTLEETTEFLKDFCSIPELDKISEDFSIPPIIEETKDDHSIEQQADMGYFADPLTGDRLRSKNSLSITKEQSSDKLENEEERQESFETFLELEEADGESEVDGVDELSLGLTLDEDKDLTKIIHDENTLESFFKMETQQEASDHEINWELILQQAAYRHLCDNVAKLIDELIDKVIEDAEHTTCESMLRKNLDKHKLMVEIFNKIHERNVEQRVCEFLNRKVVEYFKRKKVFRSIMPDSKRYVELEMRKHRQVVQHLDNLLAMEANAKLMASKTKLKMEDKLREESERSQQAIVDFEDVVKRNLFHENRPKCNVLIEKLLLGMAKCRQEVNEVRFEMILKQHTEASLKEKLSEIDHLGNGLTMKSFEGLHNETQILDRKIEERNIELRKLHERVQRDIHAMAHYKEQQKMLQNSMMAQRLALDELNDEKQQLRQRIHQLRMKRTAIRKQLRELSFDSGLLDKPALMLDYDKTNANVEEQRRIIDVLKQKSKKLEKKIKRLENSQHL
ncbi:uncharacterized protein [Musca autumnalis]|uniref:uncharacterized protein n=1 Tax=Musca autumnalis TaxID=221902 RepID=UPI003CED7E2F